MPSTTASDSRLPAWVWLMLPVMLAAWLRLRGIGDPEPFTDEGANILTALDPRVRKIFEPLEQGRPWVEYLFKPAGWFPTHGLAVARMMSAAAGVATLLALGWTLHRLAGRIVALCGLWLWALLPMAVFHERLALQDPFVTALLAWAVALVTLGTIRKEMSQPWPWFVAAGGLFGCAFLLKISAIFALPWLGLFYLGVQCHAERPLIDRRLVWIVLGMLIPVTTLGSGLWQLGSNLARYGALPAFTGGGMLPSTLERLNVWLGWYTGYGGWPLVVLVLSAVILAGHFRCRLAFLCAAGWFVSLLVTGLLYQNTYARYLLPDHLPLILFLALAWGRAAGATGRLRLVTLAALPLALIRWGLVSWEIGTNPLQAAVPAAEIAQYFTGPWSGRGLKEVRRYLDGYAEQHNVSCLVLTHRFSRPGCYGLLLAEREDPRIGVVPFTIYEPAELTVALPGLRHATAGQRAAFFILYEGSLYPPHPWLEAAGSPARRVLEVPRGAGEKFTLYQFEP
jgi:hypothetical protein